jgi:hypothetical protein
MKKRIMALIVGSVMSTAAFAAEPAANPMVLSDSQLDVVTAGGNSSQCQQSTADNSGNTVNVNVSPTVGSVNVVPIGSNSSNTSGATTNQGGNGSANGSIIKL